MKSDSTLLFRSSSLFAPALPKDDDDSVGVDEGSLIIFGSSVRSTGAPVVNMRIFLTVGLKGGSDDNFVFEVSGFLVEMEFAVEKTVFDELDEELLVVAGLVESVDRDILAFCLGTRHKLIKK